MSEQEGYTYPGTGVLRNKMDARDAESLQRFERGVTAVRIQELRESPVRGDYDLAHLQAIHKQVFKDVYEWAGQVREVDIAKGPAGDRIVFALKEDIPQRAQEIQSKIQEAGYLRGLDREQFAGKLSEVYAGVNELHAFRDGNERVAREFVGQLAKDAGYQLDYSKVDAQTWTAASRESARGNLGPAREVFYEITTVERAEVSRGFQGGRSVGEALSHEDSRRLVDSVAASRGLVVRDAELLSGRIKGEVVEVSAHHALLKQGDMVAVRYERANLDRDLAVGELVAISHEKPLHRVHEQGREPALDRGGRDAQMERDRGPSQR